MSRNVKRLVILSVITLFFGTIYVSLQQALRQSANDPQIEIAEDTAAKLDAGAPPNAIVIASVDAAKSLAAFTTIYDKKGNQVASSGYISGKPLSSIPISVLQSTGADYNAVTWQPEPNVRLASVSVAAADYYVTVARSLKEVEKREDTTFQIVAMGWLATVLVTMFAYWLLPRIELMHIKKKP